MVKEGYWYGLPLVLIGAVALFLLVEYLAAFIQYGRGGNSHE